MGDSSQGGSFRHGFSRGCQASTDLLSRSRPLDGAILFLGEKVKVKVVPSHVIYDDPNHSDRKAKKLSNGETMVYARDTYFNVFS